MKKYKFILFLSLCFVISMLSVACSDDKNDWRPTESVLPSAENDAMTKLWSTSPFDADMTTRLAAFKDIQKYADECTSTMFSTYLAGSDALAASLQKTIPAIFCYNQAFERVLEGLKNDKPASGEAYIYMLYNMGYVVKTSSGSFGIDIFHRRGAELAPYLDFYGITHIHQDHRSLPLAEAMKELGKPVLQNFLDASEYSYTSQVDKDYTIGSFKIHTFITSHNNGTTNVPVTVFKVDCGAVGGNLILMHSGDSNFLPEEYESVKDADIDVYIPRYAPNALTENNVIGSVFNPKYVLLSHILELTHADPSSSRWTLEQGLERASKLNCSQTYMPFWGERMIWKNNQLSK